jgi:hypothetical protein
VLECLAKDPAARPQGADLLAERLAAIGFAQPWSPAAAAHWWATNRPAPKEQQDPPNGTFIQHH